MLLLAPFHWRKRRGLTGWNTSSRQHRGLATEEESNARLAEGQAWVLCHVATHQALFVSAISPPGPFLKGEWLRTRTGVALRVLVLMTKLTSIRSIIPPTVCQEAYSAQGHCPLGSPGSSHPTCYPHPQIQRGPWTVGLPDTAGPVNWADPGIGEGDTSPHEAPVFSRGWDGWKRVFQASPPEKSTISDVQGKDFPSRGQTDFVGIILVTKERGLTLPIHQFSFQILMALHPNPLYS